MTFLHCMIYVVEVFIVFVSHLLCNGEIIYMNQFAVKITGKNEKSVGEIAAKHGFENLGKIGELNEYYLFQHNHVSKRSIELNHTYCTKLRDEPQVEWVEQQVELKRVKRDYIYSDFKPIESSLYSPSSMPFQLPAIYSGHFKDPLYSEQWYLHQGAAGNWDMNVKKAWLKGYTGKGVVVSILDDGIQTNHPDLIQNYDPRASTDINGNDDDPMPQDNGDNKHGTRCAGEVSATADNNICGVGIAFNASIGGVRMLDGTVNDAVEAKALSLNRDHIDIYSASWGPEDDGKTVDGPGPLAKNAFIQGVNMGRKGKGSIFVWASGNGGRHIDNCNCDGYTNSIYTLSISSVTQRGLKPWYLEECSSTLATTYSSGTPGHDRNIVTVDMDPSLNPKTMCTLDHTGTSASAPIAAALCALTLEANPHLTWRDMQYLVVLTSRSDPLMNEDGWVANGVKRKVSHKFGYGLMDGAAMVELAEQWTPVPPQHVCETHPDLLQRMIPKGYGEKLEVYMDTHACKNSPNSVVYLEHVQCKISLKFNPRGKLKIILESPSKTRSVLLFPRPRDLYQTDFQDWPFLSVHFWGERADGRWKLTIYHVGSSDALKPGLLLRWSLILYGTDSEPIRLHSRHVHEPYEFAASNHNQGGVTVMQIREDSQNEDCHKECLNGCNGKSAQDCRDCRHFQTDTDPRICVNSCPEEQYIGTNRTCHQCHPSCKSCTNPEASGCQSCSRGLYFIEGTNECKEECPKKYYANLKQQACYPCKSVCSACSGSADNCTQCRPGLVFYNSHCLASCPKRTYEGTDHSCMPCDDICETCMGPSKYECITCPGNAVHLNGTCLNTCPVGFYTHGIINECYSCDPSCLTCNATHCLSCRDDWQLDNQGQCHLITECNQGQYHNGVQCLHCHISCKTCEGPKYSDCLSCPHNRFLYRNTCISKCPNDTFIKFKRECVHCHETCNSCIGPEAIHCISCKPGLHLRGNKCSTVCGERSYPKGEDCHPCHPSCSTCTGSTEMECITCSEGLQFSEGKCQKNCPQGYFLRNKTCQPCHHSCLTCKDDGFQDCLSCKENSINDHGFCMECSQGQYYDSISQQCLLCDSSCLTCTGPDSYSCTSCIQPYKHDSTNRRCVLCCESQQQENCCHCDNRTNACINLQTTDKRRIGPYGKTSDKEGSSTSFLTGTFSLAAGITFLIVIVIILIIKAIQAKNKHHCCWNSGYQPLPLRFETLKEGVELYNDEFWNSDNMKTKHCEI